MVSASRTYRVGEPLRILVVDEFALFRESLCSFFLTYNKLLIVFGEPQMARQP
jgi:hypothetical protein